MKSFTYFVNVFLWLLLNSCGIEHTNDNYILFEGKKDPVNISAYCEFIVLETGNDHMLGGINKIEFIDDRIFILDSYKTKTLQVYNKNGKFITLIGSLGKGRGEYISSNDFWIDRQSGTIILIDHMSNDFLFFDLNTYKYIKKKRVPFYFSSFFFSSDNEYIWYYQQGYRKGRNLYCIQITDSTFTDKNIYYRDIDFVSSYSIGVRSNFYKIQDKVHFYLAYEPFIYEIGHTELIQRYEVKLSGHDFPYVDYLNSIASGNRDYTRVLIPSEYVSGYSVHETDDFMLIDFMVKWKLDGGIFDKKNKQTYKFTDIEDLIPLYLISLPFAVGVYENKFITCINPGSFKSKNINHEALRAIAENVNEEDNPIICLINFESQ